MLECFLLSIVVCGIIAYIIIDKGGDNGKTGC